MDSSTGTTRAGSLIAGGQVENMDIKALIAAQRAEMERPKSQAENVMIGGELVPIEVTKLSPDEWQALVARNSPRSNIPADSRLGYDQDKLPRNYPTEKIRVGGEPVTAEMWAEVYAVLEVAYRNIVGTLMWGLNVYEAISAMATAGKARAGQQSSSPANRESRRAASKGGSRPK